MVESGLCVTHINTLEAALHPAQIKFSGKISIAQGVPFLEKGYAWLDLNPQSVQETAPKAVAFANFATRTNRGGDAGFPRRGSLSSRQLSVAALQK
jgi:hypothetical protein